jgi:hypothetical protein
MSSKALIIDWYQTTLDRMMRLAGYQEGKLIFAITKYELEFALSKSLRD